ncbi:hypothetical protein PUNSTDRAFT_46877 [Punctularia strigosozonata HHB-11173 SS5]|uniref:uncharacterized protein n=1 Tax=Punctularia strigosozonata (strain HHB-11173) TaxID=741275 RepID=UPI0004417EE4|nr:uncharacterized protein PUNSTDRAFT_46877 [Punctularia strigosozonata HHB-11173 SS5]EIN05538.1 hypothetical protein PUNSTDRAFT_46877 [Punctularia strigosozonata HHB-11173 SS5]
MVKEGQLNTIWGIPAAPAWSTFVVKLIHRVICQSPQYGAIPTGTGDRGQSLQRPPSPIAVSTDSSTIIVTDGLARVTCGRERQIEEQPAVAELSAEGVMRLVKKQMLWIPFPGHFWLKMLNPNLDPGQESDVSPADDEQDGADQTPTKKKKKIVKMSLASSQHAHPEAADHGVVQTNSDMVKQPLTLAPTSVWSGARKSYAYAYHGSSNDDEGEDSQGEDFMMGVDSGIISSLPHCPAF